MRRKKAQRLGRRLGLPAAPASEQGARGLVLLQIDALSYFALQASLSSRYLPFLSRLLRKGRYRLHSYVTGLPATTPAFQVGLFYGQNAHVPGFRRAASPSSVRGAPTTASVRTHSWLPTFRTARRRRCTASRSHRARETRC
jgi:hypothetical protein